ncbi:hypothetical protein ACI65C_001443 [Semiaphis heraclei]
MFWSKITEIPSKPEAIEDREEIAEEISSELKGADSICEPGSMLLKVIILIILFFRILCKAEEKVKTTDVEIKVEKDFFEGCEFEGTVVNESHSSEIIAHLNSDKIYILRKKLFTCKVCGKKFSNS